MRQAIQFLSSRGGLVCAAMLVLAWSLETTSWGLINPNIRPSDIVESSREIAIVTLSAPKDDRMAAKVDEMLKGEKVPAETLVIDTKSAPEETMQEVNRMFAGASAVKGLILTILGEADSGAKNPTAMVLIGTKWFALFVEKGTCRLDKDPKDMDSIWAGGARTLTMATRALAKDPGLDFPVKATVTWGSELRLGTIKGAVNGSLPMDLGGKSGSGVLLLADAGDRFYQAAPKGGQPADITAQLKLATASKVAACGDFSGDGRMDIASWDGKKLHLARQSAEDVFVTQPLDVSLADCASLAAIDVGVARRSGLLAGTSAGPVLIVPAGKDAWKTEPLPVAPAVIKALGVGGICAAAAFSGHGLPDVVQFFSKGYIAFAAEKPGKYKAPTQCSLVLPAPPAGVIFGDFDTDGRLDMVVSGGNGSVLLSGGKVEGLADRTNESGELAYHGNLNAPTVVAIAPWDINSDGRQGLALFYSSLAPKCFFSRGFSCFGMARELLTEDNVLAPGARQIELASAATLKDGQLAGTVASLSAGGSPDLFAVDTQGTIWLLTVGARADRGSPALEVALPPGTPGPVTLTVSAKKLVSGMFVVRQGQSVRMGARSAGPLTLEWVDTAGEEHKRVVPLTGSKRIELEAK